MRDEIAEGWKISQVETLLGMPRRDIQRACYDGAGGFGIVHPRNTSWGWRVYEAADVAKLFLVAQARKQMAPADDTHREIAECQGIRELCDLLARCERKARERRDEESGVLLGAWALRCALERDDDDLFAVALDAAFVGAVHVSKRNREVLRLAAEGFFSQFAEKLASAKGRGIAAGDDGAVCVCMREAAVLGEALSVDVLEARELLAEALNAPGVGLACELWLGPATHSFMNAALEATLVGMHGDAASSKQGK